MHEEWSERYDVVDLVWPWAVGGGLSAIGVISWGAALTSFRPGWSFESGLTIGLTIAIIALSAIIYLITQIISLNISKKMLLTQVFKYSVAHHSDAHLSDAFPREMLERLLEGSKVIGERDLRDIVILHAANQQRVDPPIRH